MTSNYITHSGPDTYWDHHEAEETENALIFTVITWKIWKHWKRNMAKRLEYLGGVASKRLASLVCIMPIGWYRLRSVGQWCIKYTGLCPPSQPPLPLEKPRFSFACSKSWLAMALSKVKTQTCLVTAVAAWSRLQHFAQTKTNCHWTP